MRWRLIAALITTGLSLLLMNWPERWQALLDRFYGGVIYPWIQQTLRLLPEPQSFALIDALLLIVPLALLIRIAWQLRRQPLRRLPGAVVIVWLWLSSIYLIMMLTWGLNYHRPSLYQDLLDDGFTRNLQDNHWQFALEQTHKTAENLPENFNYCEPVVDINPDRPSAFAHSAMAFANLPTSPPRRVKDSAWSFYYRGISVAGVYMPFTGEPTYNRFSFPMSKPFVMTHEYMHWAGYAREYDADILAYWSLWLSPDPIWQYSAWLEWWRGVGAPKTVREQLNPDVQKTLTCYAQFQQQNPPWAIAKWHWQLYEQNLKAQGVPEGLKSYAMGESLALTSYQNWLLAKRQRYE